MKGKQQEHRDTLKNARWRKRGGGLESEHGVETREAQAATYARAGCVRWLHVPLQS